MGNGLSGTVGRHNNKVQRFDRHESDEAEAKKSSLSDRTAAPVRRVHHHDHAVTGPADAAVGAGATPFVVDEYVPGTIDLRQGGGGSANTHAGDAGPRDGQNGGALEDPDAELIDDGYFNVQERFMYEHDLESMPTLQNAPATWKRGDIIGSGAFGSVHVALNVDNGQLIAVKSVPIFPSSDDADHSKRMRDLRMEIGLMGKLNHPNIVRYLGTSSDKQHFNILMEFVPGGSIASMLKNFGVFEELVVSRCVRACVRACLVVHACVRASCRCVFGQAKCLPSDPGQVCWL